MDAEKTEVRQMNGFMTLLTGVLALLILGLMAFLLGEDLYTNSFSSQSSVASVTRPQQAVLLPDISAVEGATCQEDGDVYDGKLDSNLTGATASNVTTVSTGDSEILNDLKLPEGLSLNITGTGETCK